jgi:hypothetical protein
MQTSQKTLAVNSTSVLLVWPANKRRSYLTVQNQSTLDLLVNVGATPSSSNALIIPPGDEWSPVNPPKGDIRITGTAAAGISQKLFTIEESE